MTPQELSALPVGTRIKLAFGELNTEGDLVVSYDYGTIKQSGVEVHINWGPNWWMEGVFTEDLITHVYTPSKAWEVFIADISLATEPQS